MPWAALVTLSSRPPISMRSLPVARDSPKPSHLHRSACPHGPPWPRGAGCMTSLIGTTPWATTGVWAVGGMPCKQQATASSRSANCTMSMPLRLPDFPRSMTLCIWPMASVRSGVRCATPCPARRAHRGCSPNSVLGCPATTSTTFHRLSTQRSGCMTKPQKKMPRRGPCSLVSSRHISLWLCPNAISMASTWKPLPTLGCIRTAATNVTLGCSGMRIFQMQTMSWVRRSAAVWLWLVITL